jgi:hypothetical protein
VKKIIDVILSNSRHIWQNHVRNSVAKKDCFAPPAASTAADDDYNDSEDKITKSDIYCGHQI